jgi:DNA invertase Pin-like site-specific DNA recombinase
LERDHLFWLEQKGCGMTETRPLRCAIYTRKSTEEGLDQAFNSLQAQRESGEAYIASQQARGWPSIRIWETYGLRRYTRSPSRRKDFTRRPMRLPS